METTARRVVVGTLRRGSQRMGGPAPEWIQIFPYPSYVGELDGERFEWVTDELSQQSCVELWQLRENDLVIDWEHQSDEGGEAPAAGRIVELRAGGEYGLLARVEWTDKAREQIESGAYFYDSPSFWFSPEDRRIYGLRHLALTNNPASWGRPYLTDHTRADYGITREASGGKRLQLVAASAATGGRKTMDEALGNLIESLCYLLRLPVTATGKEIHDALAKIGAAIPNTDAMLLLGDQAAQASGEDAPATLAQLVDRVRSDRAGEQAAAASQAQSAVPPSVLLALGMESGTAEQAALAIMNLKATSVPLADHAALQEQLRASSTATAEERIALAIAAQRHQGKKILPYLEAELRRVAQKSLPLALATLDSLPSADFAPQSGEPAVEVERAAQLRIEMPATPGAARRVASQSAREETLAIMRANPSLTYTQANEKRLTEKKRIRLAA